MKVLVACEYSGRVRDALIERGHDAWSCDILPSEGKYNDKHLMQDVREVLADEWDMIIAFPPCTHLAVSGARHFAAKRADGRQQEGIDFFMLFANHPCPRIAIENPVGIMSNVYRKPDQIIQPYQYGDEAQKTTCLWLKGLPKLIPTKIVGRGEMITYPSGKVMPKWYAEASGNGKKRGTTFQGIADAMADQWGGLLQADAMV